MKFIGFKRLCLIVALCLAAAQTTVFGAGLSGSELTHDVDVNYSDQAVKTVFAFFTADPDAVLPETSDDIVILAEDDKIEESYTITVPEQRKDFIVFLFGGSDGETTRSVIVLSHTNHFFSNTWSYDENNHYRKCEYEGCDEVTDLAPHTFITDDGDCTTGGTCEVCGYTLPGEYSEHLYHNALDDSCDRPGCLGKREAAAVSITYDANGGTVPEDATAATGDDGKLTANLVTPVRNGWEFQGWFTAPGGGAPVTNESIFYEDATIYAHWKSKFHGSGGVSGSGGGGSGGGFGTGVGSDTETEYELKFNTNGGTEIKSVKGKKNLTINLGKYATTKENCEFLGWCKDADLENIITEVVLTGDTTIYAKWSEGPGPSEEPVESAAPPEEEGGFSDVEKDDWFYDAVDYVRERGIMNGISDSEFDPHGTATRGMVVTMLYRLEGEPDVPDEAEFSDVTAEDYYGKAAAWANEQEIVTGYGDGRFGPEDEVSREQMAAVLYRYARSKGYDVSADDGDITAFEDAESVSEYATDAIKWAVKVGIINGNENKLTPAENAERAQVAALFMRFCNLYDNPQTDVGQTPAADENEMDIPKATAKPEESEAIMPEDSGAETDIIEDIEIPEENAPDDGEPESDANGEAESPEENAPESGE